MFAGAMLLAGLAVTAVSPLPERFGDFVRGEIDAQPIARSSRELYDEYNWRAAYRAEYVDSHGRRMAVESFRFLDAEGAHAAYLCARPAGGVSPMIWNIDAVTGSGETVMQYRNYVFRFHGALPSISSSMEEMLAKLPELTADASPWDLGGRYLDRLSTRMILGPVSLERFAGEIRPSVVGFHTGAKGRVGRFETPAGPMTEIVFEYPTEKLAKERARLLEALPHALVRVDRACVGVILKPTDPALAEEMLSGGFGAPVAFTGFNDMHEAMSLDEGIGMTLWAFVVGALVAGVRRRLAVGDPFPNRMTFLRL